MHHMRLRRNGNPNLVKRIANNTYKRMICEVVDCKRPVRTNGYCNMHYQRVFRLGEVGQASPLFAEDGTGYISKQHGYKFIGGVREHRIIAGKLLTKPWPIKAVVHHLNGDRADNRNCNLVVCPDEAYHKLLHKRQKLLGYAGPKRLAEPELLCITAEDLGLSPLHDGE